MAVLISKIQRAEKHGADPVRAGPASSADVGVVTTRAMALWLAAPGAHTRRPTGELVSPALQLLEGELGKLDVSQRRQNVGIGTTTQDRNRRPCATLGLQ